MTAPRRARGDEGTVMILVLGFTVVLLGLLVLVVDVSVLLLAQRGVASAADGAAVAAAQELDESELYRGGLDRCVPLDDARVRATVARYAEQDGTGTQLAGSTPDPFTVEVDAARAVRLPFGAYVGLGAVTVRSSARASSPLVGSTDC